MAPGKHNTFRPHSSLFYRPTAPEAQPELRNKKWLNPNLTCGTSFGAGQLY